MEMTEGGQSLGLEHSGCEILFSNRQVEIFLCNLSLTLLGPGPVIVFRGTLMGSARETGEETSTGMTEAEMVLVMWSR